MVTWQRQLLYAVMFLLAVWSMIYGVVSLALMTPQGRRWRQRRFWRRVSGELGYSRAARYPLEVPFSVDFRPGYTIRMPSRTSYPPGIGPDLTRKDFIAMVGPRTFVSALCFSAEHRHLLAERSAHIALENLRNHGMRIYEEPAPSTMAGEPAVRYVFSLSDRGRVIEWKFKRDGWLFAVGIQCHEPDPEAEDRALRCLQTWQWSDPPEGYSPMSVTTTRDGAPLPAPQSDP